jgi:hypothetical protein
VFLSYDSKPLRVFPGDFIHACFDPLHVNAFSTSLMETDSLSQKVDCLRPTTPNGAFFVQLDRFRIDGDVAERLQEPDATSCLLEQAKPPRPAAMSEPLSETGSASERDQSSRRSVIISASAESA